MPIRSKTNLYSGINPHLNNFLQFETGWKGFHNWHLGDIAVAIEQQLPESYYATGEESLQIGVYDNFDVPLQKPTQTTPDITLYSTSEETISPLYEVEGDVVTFRLIDTLTEKEEFISSIVIYKLQDGNNDDKPVTRIELLSPANKYPGSHHVSYMNKRLKTIQAGLRLIEIDNLHYRRPLLEQIKYYPHDTQAKPYHVLVSDPRPDFIDGKIHVYSFGVLDEIPEITIPLDNDDTIEFDLNTVYQQTFGKHRYYYQKLVDYEQEPVHMDSFTPDDQQAIRDTMARITETQP